MFTGIIQAVGRIERIDVRGGDWRLTVSTGKLDLSDVQLGDSIATSGVCLTAVELGKQHFVADVSAETLSVTTFQKKRIGDPVNLEKALRLADRLGGHLVSGHVDGIGTIREITPAARSWRYVIEMPVSLARYVAAKGSITVDGISLTVNRVHGVMFEVNIVPHTRKETTMETLKVGDEVNLEVDLIARYLERLLTAPADDEEDSAEDIQARNQRFKALLGERGLL